MTLLDLIERNSGTLALIDYDSGSEFTWGELKNLSYSLDGHLSTMEGRVALLCPKQGPHFLAALIGCWRYGILPILVSDGMTSAELHRLFKVIGNARLLALWCEGLSNESIRQTTAQFLKLKLDSGSDQKIEAQCTLSEDHPALGLMTSGTRDAPKVVVFSHRNLVESAKIEVNNDSSFGSLPVLNLRPPFTSGGLNSLWPCLLSGTAIVTSDDLRQKPLARSLANLLQSVKLNLAIMSPAYIQALAAQEFSTPLSPESLKLYFGGMSLGSKALSWLRRNNFNPCMRYGMTEIGHIVSKTELTDPSVHNIEPNNMGRPYRGIAIRVTDDHLSFQSPGVASFQFVDGQRIPLSEGGWWCSDDRGSLKSDGSILLTGREHEIIAVRGFRFHAGEVQDLIMNSDLIEQAFVLGVSDALDGQTPVAFCVLSSRANDQGHCRRELQKILEKHLSPPKRPKHYIFLEKLPYLPNGKIDLAALKKLTKNFN